MDYFFTSSHVPSSSSSHDGSKDKKKKGTSTGGKEGTSNGAGMKLSTVPQSVAARERRHRISHRFKILQSLVPGRSKMDTVSMLEEAINYVKFLQAQIVLHQTVMSLDDQDPSLNSSNYTLPADHGPFPPHQPSYLDTLNYSLPELEITNSLPLPDSSGFRGEDEATSTYGGFLKN